MSHKLNALVAAVLTLAAAGAARANLVFPNAQPGNSSVAFVALDNAGTISYAADLSVRTADFLPFIDGQTLNAGTLSAAGTTAVFNLYDNTYTLNGVAQTANYSWSGNLNSFLSAAGSGAYQWGVVAGDATPSLTVSATNPIRGQNILFTSGSVVDYDTSNESGINPQAVSDANGQITQFFAASNAAPGKTHAANVFGSDTATSGVAFLGQSMALYGIGNFSQQFGNNNYLQNPGDTSYFSWTAVNGPATTATLGQTLSFGSPEILPATWTWNEVTGDLTYTVPVPEPETYLMLIAGLASIGFVVRRRQQ